MQTFMINMNILVQILLRFIYIKVVSRLMTAFDCKSNVCGFHFLWQELIIFISPALMTRLRKERRRREYYYSTTRISLFNRVTLLNVEFTLGCLRCYMRDKMWSRKNKHTLWTTTSVTIKNKKASDIGS